jgi:hypothetical protein
MSALLQRERKHRPRPRIAPASGRHYTQAAHFPHARRSHAGAAMASIT